MNYFQRGDSKNESLANLKKYLAVMGSVIGVFLIALSTHAAVLGVTQITAVQTFASADGIFDNGWKWVFDVTVPTDETIVKMKFADWTNGASKILAANNIRYYSAQSSNASDASHAIVISASATYADAMKINSGADLDVAKAGRQIQITVEASVPENSAGGSYSTSYGIQSNPDPDVPVITVDVYNTTPTNSDVVVTASTGIGTLNETSHTFTTNGSFDFIATGPTGIITTKTVTVTNIDKTRPVIANHSDVTAAMDDPEGAIVNYSRPAVTDNSDQNIVTNCLPMSGSLFAIGDTLVTCNATDAAGNAATPKTFKVTVSSGHVTFSFNGPSTGDISVGSNDAVLERFAITSVSRVDIRNLRMRISASSAITSDIVNITDCKIKNTDTGAAVTNQYDLVNWINAGNDQVFTKTFSDNFEVGAGQTLNLALTCDILSTSTTALSGKSLTATVDARVLGDIRNLDADSDIILSDIVPSTALVGNQQTVRSSGLTIGLAVSPTSTTVTKGSTTNALGVNFTAGSSSDIKITQMRLRGFISLDGSNNFGTTVTDSALIARGVQDIIQSATLWDGSTQLGMAQSPDANGDINFTNLSWNVPAGTTKTVIVRVVLSNSLPYGSGSNRFMIDLIGDGTSAGTTINITAQDKDSNSVLAISQSWGLNSPNLQIVGSESANSPVVDNYTVVDTAIGSGTLTVQLDDDTPASSIITANTSDNSVTRVKFTSINEAFNVVRLTVANIGSALSSRSITSIRLFDKNGTLFCSGALDSNSRLRCANDAGLFTVNGSGVVTIKVNIDQEGSGTTGANSGDRPVFALYADTGDVVSDDIKAIGVSSGTALRDADIGNGSLNVVTTTVDGTSDYIEGNMMVVRKTQPTVATIATSTTLTTNPTLYKFSITAAPNADVALKRFNLSESNVGVALSSYRVYENDTLLDRSLYRVCADAVFQNGVVTCSSDLWTDGTIASDTSKTVTVVFNTERVVAAGTTKTYRIDATATGVGAGDSVTHKLIDDYTASVETDNLDSTTLDDNNFIWSDNSADSHSAVPSSSSFDWTNGKYVRYLPTNPHTISL